MILCSGGSRIFERGVADLTEQNNIGTLKDKLASKIVLFSFKISSLNEWPATQSTLESIYNGMKQLSTVAAGLEKGNLSSNGRSSNSEYFLL